MTLAVKGDDRWLGQATTLITITSANKTTNVHIGLFLGVPGISWKSTSLPFGKNGKVERILFCKNPNPEPTDPAEKAKETVYGVDISTLATMYTIDNLNAQLIVCLKDIDPNVSTVIYKKLEGTKTPLNISPCQWGWFISNYLSNAGDLYEYKGNLLQFFIISLSAVCKNFQEEWLKFVKDNVTELAAAFDITAMTGDIKTNVELEPVIAVQCIIQLWSTIGKDVTTQANVLKYLQARYGALISTLRLSNDYFSKKQLKLLPLDHFGSLLTVCPKLLSFLAEFIFDKKKPEDIMFSEICVYLKGISGWTGMTTIKIIYEILYQEPYNGAIEVYAIDSEVQTFVNMIETLTNNAKAAQGTDTQKSIEYSWFYRKTDILPISKFQYLASLCIAINQIKDNKFGQIKTKINRKWDNLEALYRVKFDVEGSGDLNKLRILKKFNPEYKFDDGKVRQFIQRLRI